MATVKLWNTELGKVAPYEVSIDRNGEVVCDYSDGSISDTIKFPGGLTKAQFEKLVKAHNDANEGVKALDQKELEKRDKRNQELLDSL